MSFTFGVRRATFGVGGFGSTTSDASARGQTSQTFVQKCLLTPNVARRTPNIIFLLLTVSSLFAATECSIDGVVPWSDPRGWTPVHVSASCFRDFRTTVTVELAGGSAALPLALSAGVKAEQWVLLPPSAKESWWGMNANWRQPDGSEGRTSFNPILDHQHALLVVRAPTNRVRGGGALSALHLPRASGSSCSHGGTGAAPFRPEEIDPGQLPDQWQAYPSWLALVFMPGAEAVLSGNQRQALLRWIGQGGTVAMEPKALAAWRSVDQQPVALPMDGELAAAADDARWSDLMKAITARIRLADSGFEADLPSNRVPGTEGQGAGMVVLAVLVTLVVGALPLWWARRRRQPMFLLVAIPTVSGAACLVLLGWDVARYGVSARRTAVEMTLVDPVRSEHITWTEQTRFGAWGVGVLPVAGGERWLDNAIHEDRHEQRSRRVLVDAGVVTGDLVRGRENTHLACTVVRPDRRRVEIRRDGQHWVVANGLGVAITGFTWIAPGGQRLHATSVADGAVSSLDPGTNSVSCGEIPRLPAFAGQTWMRLSNAPNAWSARLAAPLTPLPGLIATDVEPVAAYACGLVEVTP